MAELKTACSDCRAEILLTTAERNGGLCAPCYRIGHPIRFELTPADEARLRAIDAIRGKVLTGCSAEEFAALRCPVCGGPLRLDAHPRRRIVSVGCVADTSHVRFDGVVAEPPAWWSIHHRDGGWLFDPPARSPA
jgi:hypothetical protein